MPTAVQFVHNSQLVSTMITAGRLMQNSVLHQTVCSVECPQLQNRPEPDLTRVLNVQTAAEREQARRDEHSVLHISSSEGATFRYSELLPPSSPHPAN
jgi:hypothetical protein